MAAFTTSIAALTRHAGKAKLPDDFVERVLQFLLASRTSNLVVMPSFQSTRKNRGSVRMFRPRTM
jgi:hypothetical protein